MIKIYNQVEKKQKNFWNGCVFHPTDAVEDPWGKRILDQMAADGAIKTVRVYAMFEDIVYLDGNDELQFDFRLSDTRLDYLVEKGYRLLLAYAGMPDCIAKTCSGKTTAAKNKTRYKGKMWNTSPPKTVELWEEVCYQYTRHLVERYGEETLSKWYCHCFNESDISLFFMSDLSDDAASAIIRAKEYCGMYEAFIKGVRRACKGISVGGPALAQQDAFLEYFLNTAKEKGWKLDFISLHYYGTNPRELNEGKREFSVSNLLEQHDARMQVIKKCGFIDTPIIIDEWGAVSHGFFNREECPFLIFRETEKYASYFTRLIHDIIYSERKLQELMICLSGQHEMVEDFSGFRNFFTLNFIKKPIYNAYVLASKLGENILKHEKDNEHTFIIPTKTESGGYALLLTYAADNFAEDFSSLEESISFEEDISNKTLTIWTIDKQHTNPYALYKKMEMGELTSAQMKLLREEGQLKPTWIGKGAQMPTLHLSANATLLITIE